MKRCLYFAVLAGLLMVAVPQSALAEKPSYSYVEAGYNKATSRPTTPSRAST